MAEKYNNTFGTIKFDSKTISLSYHSVYNSSSYEWVGRSTTTGLLPPIMAFIVGILLFVFFMRLSSGNSHLPTFYGFLDMLQNVPQIDISWNFLQFQLGDWIIGTVFGDLDLNFIRDFVQFNLNIVSFLSWLVVNLVNCVLYIFYFLRWVISG